jgi:hypothetical protein
LRCLWRAPWTNLKFDDSSPEWDGILTDPTRRFLWFALAEASGLSVVQLVELKDSLESLGVSTERLPQQVTKLSQNIAAAGGGSKEASHLFHQLGIETEGWAGKLPSSIDVLLQMSHHLKESSLSTNDLAAASKLLGRNSFETVAFLKQGDDAIKQQMKSHEAHARAVNESVQAARQLQQTAWAEENRRTAQARTWATRPSRSRS